MSENRRGDFFDSHCIGFYGLNSARRAFRMKQDITLTVTRGVEGMGGTEGEGAE